MKVDLVADMKVDMVADMKVDMVADMKVDKVANMKVDMVADMDCSIIFWAFLSEIFLISQWFFKNFQWSVLNFSVKCFEFFSVVFWLFQCSVLIFSVKCFVFLGEIFWTSGVRAGSPEVGAQRALRLLVYEYRASDKAYK